jgi:hypothetical protein
MPLTGEQAQQLHHEILSAFSRPELERLVRFDLNARIEEIARTTDTFATVVLDLIHWAEKHGRTEVLIRAVRRARPERRSA